MIEDGVGRTIRAWVSGENEVNALVDDSQGFKSMKEIKNYIGEKVFDFLGIGKFNNKRGLDILFGDKKK